MKKSFIIASAIIILFSFCISCSKKDQTVDNSVCDGVAKNFTADVNPLIQTYCNQAACHDNNSINGPGPLTNYAQVFSARSDIRGAVQAGIMPQNTTLTTAQKNTIICWIDNGAPNN